MIGIKNNKVNLSSKIESILNLMESFLKNESFKGWDAHDGLNSSFLNLLLKKNRIFAILVLQLIKNSPFNFRPFLKIPKSYNPKGMALLLEAYILKFKVFRDEKTLKEAKFFADWLINNYTKGYSGTCWGYPFDWANRKFFAPKWTPNIIVSVFCANALLNYYTLTKEKEYLETAQSVCNFIIRDLHKTKKKDSICFSYTPIDKTCIHNANMFGSAHLARVGSLTKNSKYKKYSIMSMDFSINSQNEDGSWFYGKDHNQKWIDSFHTGYSLIALSSFIKETGLIELKKNLIKGYDFYKANFFLRDGKVSYYHHRVYPLDSHAFAHAIICLCHLSYLDDNKELIDRIIRKLISIFWSGKGYFYYQKNKFLTIKIPYLRWVQAWVFLALLTYLDSYKKS